MKLRSLALAGFLFVALPLASSFAQVGVSINVAPPVLPVVVQPPAPVEGYIWNPGYWGYGDVNYYWVPGIWVAPPAVGLLWTPPYWGFNNGAYMFNDGYWGPTVGFYGGINYGYGYFGSGYWGGRWDGNVFRYNTAVTRVNTSAVHNTFVDRSVLSKEVKGTRASFNGPNGVKAEPTAEERAAAENAQKVQPTSQQVALREAASKNRDLQASVNHGHPKAEAIKSVQKQGQQVKGTGEAAAGKAENKPGNVSETANKKKAEAGSNAEEHANKRNVKTGEAGARSSKATEHGSSAHGRHEVIGTSRHAVNAPRQGGGNRGQAPKQQQGKKRSAKPGSPNGQG